MIVGGVRSCRVFCGFAAFGSDGYVWFCHVVICCVLSCQMFCLVLLCHAICFVCYVIL